MGYTTQDIRNVALVGPAGAGKTLLLEALLLQAGVTRAKGSLQRGSTVSDFDPQEKRLQHSIDTAICSFDCKANHFTMLDTPGYPDFIGRAFAVLEAVESAAIVISAAAGVDTLTERLMEFAQDRGLCRLIIVNKIDSRDAHPERVLAELRAHFGAECLPLNLPSAGGTSVVDCFLQPDGEAADFSSVKAAHTQILDQVVEVDEALMPAISTRVATFRRSNCTTLLSSRCATGISFPCVSRQRKRVRGFPSYSRSSVDCCRIPWRVTHRHS